MLGKKQSPFQLDSFHTRSKRVKTIYSAETIYARELFSNLAVLAFVFIDLFCLKVVWNLVQTESPMFVWCIAFACAAALDVPLAIAAISLKKYLQGLCSKSENILVMVLSIAVFVVAFVFSFGFRLVTRDLSFDVGTASMLTNTVGTTVVESDTGNSTVMYAALFNGVIPLLTSISSFVISFFACNPLDAKLLKLEKEKVALQSNILEGKKALAEAEDSKKHCLELLARENDLYAEFINQLDAEGATLKQLVRVIQMEKLSTPQDVTSVLHSSEELAKNTQVGQRSEELPELLKKELLSAPAIA